MGRRLYLRLYLAFLAVLVAVALVVLLVSALLGRLGPQLYRRGPRIAAHLARLLPTDPGQQQAVGPVLERASDELDLDLVVLAPDGHEVARAGRPFVPPPGVELERLGQHPDWLGPMLVGARLGVHHGNHGPQAEGPGQGFLVVHLPRPEPGSAWPLRALLLLAAVLSVTAALLYPLSRSITRPLERLAGAAAAFGSGDLSRRSGIVANDEVGLLARSFDEMVGRIAAARRNEKELLANVSHELRTPLQRMKLGLELIEPPPGPAGEALRKRLLAMGEEIEELSRLISDVLTVSRLDLADLPVRLQPVDLHALLVRSRTRALALSAEPPVELNCPEGLAVSVDEALFGRVIDNLIDNARKYGGTAPVRVEVQRDGQWLVLAVTDGGPGFPAQELPRVFEPFFRGSNAGGELGGFGLGLALARRVVELHRGTIAASNAPGGGARIEVRLPAGA